MTIEMIYEINNTYMAINGDEIETTEDFRHRMLQKNVIRGIIFPEIRLINNEKKVFIDVSGKESLLNRFGVRLVDRQEAKALFESIFCTVKNASKYLLSEKDIVFRPEFVLKNPVTKEYEFLALPFKEGTNGKEGMKELLQFLMMHLDNSDEKLVNAIYGIHEMYCENNPNFSVAFEYFINETKEMEEPAKEEPKAEEIFTNNVLLQKNYYIPSLREIIALTLCLGGITIIGINIYWSMLLI